jgi:hypothetical protein
MNNQPAFPTGIITDGKGKIIGGSNGMTLRDYFASRALQGLMAGRWKADMHGIPYDAYRADADEWAKSAYHFADAMLKARES